MRHRGEYYHVYNAGRLELEDGVSPTGRVPLPWLGARPFKVGATTCCSA